MKKLLFSAVLLFAASATCRAAVPELTVGYADIDNLDFTALLSWSAGGGG